ncbi:AI-2E family transporter [Candidatus Peregrinibacteria bacterium]|nr:AI-2E family transporter [Candidatus Peregrinibacteria bacterium]
MKKKHVFDRQSLIIEKLPAYFLFAFMIWVAWNLLVVVSPFLMVLIFSAIIATVTFPIYAKFEKWFRGRKRLASIVTCLLVVFAIVIPITLFLLILAGQAVDLYRMVNDYLQTVDVTALMKWEKGNLFFDISGSYSSDVAVFVQQNMDALKNGLTESAKFISTFAAKQSAKLLTDLGLTLFNLLLMSFTLYFFYKDGRYILKRLMILSPIPVEYEKEIFTKFDEISRATLFGTFMTAIAQGLVAWIGFAIAGIPSGFFWATAVSLFSLVPTVGTSIVWLPMGLIMLISGNLWGAFILIWGFGLISTVDNVLRVVFLSSTTNLNPLMTFISIFGGILAFGLIGVIFGPMLLVLFFTLLHVYELEYAEILGKEDEVELEDPVFPNNG